MQLLGLTCSACRSVYPLRTRVSRGPTHRDEDHATHDECRKRPHVRIACRRYGSKITYHSAAFPRTVPSRRSSDERSRRFARRPRHDEMNDESLSADNDVARSLARRCKQSDGSCRRLNHYVSYTQPHPSILMRPPQQQQPARPSVSSPVTPSLAAAASTPARSPAAGNEIIALMHVAYAVGPVNHSTPVLAAAWFSSVRTAGPHAQGVAHSETQFSGSFGRFSAFLPVAHCSP